jgi:hypothetical protein
MFDVDVSLDITLSKKSTGAATKEFKVQVGIRISGDESGGVWRQLDKPDFRIPSDGNWVPVPTGVILNSGRESSRNSQHFAFLRTMGIPPQMGAIGPINVFSPGQKDYTSPNLKWDGNGDFRVLTRHANLPIAPESTWRLMKKNMWDTVGNPLGWNLTTTGGISFSGGSGGRGVEVIPHATVYMENDKTHEERSFNFVGAGVGYMLPGASMAISHHDLPSTGTELTKGNMPISDPFRLEDLEGMCQILEISGGGIIPIKGGAGAGPGGSAWGVIFGVPGGLAFGGFKATGWVAGAAVLAGKAGFGLGAVLNLGYMTLNKKTR